MKRFTTILVFSIATVIFAQATAADAQITDFNSWTQVTDPADPNFTSSVDTATQISLLAAGGPISTGTDIGYQSINGLTPAPSTAGHAFDPAASFQVAIDFAMSFTSPVGGLAIGFGIGEDQGGMNSAGAGLFTQNGIPSVLFGGAARVNDVDQPPQLILAPGQLSGSLFAAYDAASGDVTLGVGSTGALAPATTTTFAAIQNSWNGGPLFPAFFLRSDDFLVQAWTSGNATAVFSDFRVISGTPQTVPESATLSMFAIGGLAISRLRATRRRMISVIHARTITL